MKEPAYLHLTVIAASDPANLGTFYQALTGWPQVVNETNYVELSCPYGAGIAVYESPSFLSNFHSEHPVLGDGLGRTELYLHVTDVAAAMECAVDHGGAVLSEPVLKDWGEIVGYVTDPEDNVIALAHRVPPENGV